MVKQAAVVTTIADASESTQSSRWCLGIGAALGPFC